jgi:hypothetical protein
VIDLNWANERQPRGHSLEQIEHAREQQTQAAQASMQVDLARIPALRAQAAEMLAVLMPGPARGAVQAALRDLDTAPSIAHQVVAARQLDTVLQQWAQAAVIDRDLQRSVAPALAQQAAQRAAEERRPKPLTVEQRLDRIEQRLGLA